MKAVLDHVVVAESFDVIVVNGTNYFPPGSLNDEFFEMHDDRGAHHKTGERVYFDLVVHGERSERAAWFYPKPKKSDERIKDYVTFGNPVDVVSS